MRFSLILAVLLLAFSVAQATTINVPADQPTIQAGIDAASEGDTVLVATGVYKGTVNRGFTYNSKLIAVIFEKELLNTVIKRKDMGGKVRSQELVCNPTVTTLSPAMNDIDAPDSSDVSMTFSSSMDPASYNDTTFVVHGRSSGPQSGAVSGDATNLSMTQDSPFTAGEVVTATATTGLRCANDLDMEQGYTWQFTTAVDSNSPGTFPLDSSYSAGDCPRSVIAADLDGDGDLDLATANVGSDDVSVLLNEGDGTFAHKVDYAAGDYARSVFAADLDGDNNGPSRWLPARTTCLRGSRKVTTT